MALEEIGKTHLIDDVIIDCEFLSNAVCLNCNRANCTGNCNENRNIDNGGYDVQTLKDVIVSKSAADAAKIINDYNRIVRGSNYEHRHEVPRYQKRKRLSHLPEITLGIGKRSNVVFQLVNCTDEELVNYIKRQMAKEGAMDTTHPRQIENRSYYHNVDALRIYQMDVIAKIRNLNLYGGRWFLIMDVFELLHPKFKNNRGRKARTVVDSIHMITVRGRELREWLLDQNIIDSWGDVPCWCILIDEYGLYKLVLSFNTPEAAAAKKQMLKMEIA